MIIDRSIGALAVRGWLLRFRFWVLGCWGGGVLGFCPSWNSPTSPFPHFPIPRFPHPQSA